MSPVGEFCTNARLLMTIKLQLLQREVTNIGATSAFNEFPVNKLFSDIFFL